MNADWQETDVEHPLESDVNFDPDVEVLDPGGGWFEPWDVLELREAA